MDGIFIPTELLKIKDLTSTEKIVLALYKYYTENGKYKCCSLTNVQIADELCISKRQLIYIKNHLRELGYIMTSGIKVTYIGVSTTGGEVDFTGGVKCTSLGVKQTSPQGRTTVHPKGEADFTHKKEKKEKKEIKKEMSEKKTNLDLLLDKLPEDYKTPETIDFIKTNYLDRINELDLSDGGKVESYVVSLKSLLLNNFIIYHKINKPVPVKKTEDDFMF